jgi:hypothetical protein
MTAPAAFKRATTGASVLADGASASTAEPQRVGRPATSINSLDADGDAVQRTTPAPAAELVAELLGPGECSLLIESDHGVVRVVAQAGEDLGDMLGGGEPPGADGGGESAQVTR